MSEQRRLAASVAAVAAVALLAVFGGTTATAQGPQGPELPANDMQPLLGLTGAQTPATAPTQENAEPPLAPVPRAMCGTGSHPLAGEQGRVPAAALDSPEAVHGYTCNVSVVSRSTTLPGGFRVWRYVDRSQHVCAFYDTSLFSALNFASLAAGPSPGVAVLDMSNVEHPVVSALLTDPAMLAPHESLNLNSKRGLLAAEMGNGGTLPGLMSIYDVSRDCRHPALDAIYPAARFGHESGFAPDGNTFWIGGGEGIAAVDVRDPKNPHTLWEGNEFAHGLNLSDDGNTLYDSEPINGELLTLDVSQVQARMPQPMVHEISRLTWKTVAIPQNTIPVVIGGHRYLIEFDEFAFRFNPATVDDKVGGARIIDPTDPRHPHVVSNIRLEVNMRDAHQAADNDPSALGPGPATTYGSHYCAVPREVDPVILACSFINSGLRVFDIRDPEHPKETGYYIAPPGNSVEPGASPANVAMSQPAFDEARHDVWYTDATSGFYVLHLTPDAWPSDTSAVRGVRVRCLAARTFTVRLGGRYRIRSARVTIGGRRVHSRVAGPRRIRIRLQRVPRHAFTVRIVARTTRGIVRTARRYRACAMRGG